MFWFFARVANRLKSVEQTMKPKLILCLAPFLRRATKLATQVKD
jgi:hypothetical protein